MTFKRYIFPALLVAAAFTAIAQNNPAPVVRAELIPDSIAIGDRFRIEVRVDKDIMQVVDFPSFGVGPIDGGDLESVGESAVDTVFNEGRRVTLRKSYTMTIFDEGIYSIGRFPVLYADRNVIDTLHSFDSLVLMVTSFDIDTTTQTIHDIKPPLHVPVLFAEFSGYLIMGIIALYMLTAIYLIISAYAVRGKKYVPQRPSEPAHVIAIRELEKLDGEKLWQNNRHKLYYTRLTDIIRQYIEHRWGLNAMEMTSGEIIEALHDVISENRSGVQLRRLLSTADYVKFAKYLPAVEDNEMSFNDAYWFVEDTKFEVAEQEEKEEGQ